MKTIIITFCTILLLSSQEGLLKANNRDKLWGYEYQLDSSNILTIFKMNLLLDGKSNIIGSKEAENYYEKENNSLQKIYDLFNQYVDIKIDTLPMINSDCDQNKYTYQRNLTGHGLDLFNYRFFRLKEVIVSPSIQDFFYIPYNSSKEQEFVLAIDMITGRSYRIKGFHGNDFIQLLSDIYEKWNHSAYGKFSARKFIKYFHVEGLDFECIYKGCLKIDKNWERHKRGKYPCLQQATAPVIIYG